MTKDTHSLEPLFLEPLFEIAPLKDELAAGTPVITANHRLARQIHQAWGLHCRDNGLQTWTAVTAMALDSWLNECWLELADRAFTPALTGALATPFQELVLWEEVIDADGQFHAGGFADLARQGWQRVCQWQLSPDTLEGSSHDGARTLARWGHDFEQRLAERGLINREQQAHIVMTGFRQGLLPRHQRIVLAGFQTLPPLHQALLDSAGDQVHHYHKPETEAPAGVFTATGFDDEVAASAQWAREQMKSRPGSRIGIVVPGLAGVRDSVERIFRHHFDPSWCLPDAGYRPAPFNISAATVLADSPLVAAALALLALNRRQPLPVEDLCQLLNNPFWGRADSEGPIRGRTLRRLLDLGHPEVKSSRLRQLLTSGEEDTPGSELQQRLLKLADLSRRQPDRQRYSQWRVLFDSQLDTLGWPGERPLDSLEYQQREHWQQLLDQFDTLDQVAPPATVDQALGHLAKLAAATSFQAETPDSQVQILGTLEAAGLHFSRLWVMAMDDRQWPQAPSPHPLLPVDLQRRLGMPRACIEREAVLNRALFDLFRHSADAMVCSYSNREGDSHLQPAQLIRGLPAASLTAVAADHPWTSVIAATGERETISDHRGPALDPERESTGGGSALLADQGQCPFNAFARWRLGAEPLPEPAPGLDPMTRGVLVHDALDNFWTGLPDLAALLALDEQQRQARIDDAVAAACRRLSTEDHGQRYLEVEAQRLRGLLTAWLDLEARRRDFAVAETEQSARLELDGFALRLRIDRIDRLPDGSLVVIDYKTGRAGIGGLAGDRLTAPQLPLYALAQATTGNAPLAAVGYGLVGAGNTGFAGIGGADTGLPGITALGQKGLPETWESTLAQWRRGLETLVEEFRTGEATLAFYDRTAESYGDHLEPLNRWPGRQPVASEPNDGYGDPEP